MGTMKRLPLRWVIVLCFPACAFAQVVTSTIYGTVADPNGALIPGAGITAQNEGTGATAPAKTNPVGEFTISSLQPGVYTVTIEAPGFQTSRRPGLTLVAGQRLRINFTLELGAVTQAVEVTAETPLVNAATAEQRTNLETIQLSQLPAGRRDWTNLLTLANGVSTSSGRATVSLNGLPPSSFRITVDGTDASQDTEFPSLTMNGNFNNIKSASMEAVAEVNIVKGIASAEIANTLSGNVNISTKSGSNAMHGSLFWLGETENLDARNQMLATKPGLAYNQFGGSVGGPLARSKLFFFGVFDGYRLRGFQALTENSPTAEFQALVAAATPIYNKVFALFPKPNQPYAANAVTGRWVGAGSQQGNDNHALTRIDWHKSDTTILTGRYTRGRPFQSTPRPAAANSRTWQGTTEQGSFSATHSRPAWTSESRIGYNFNRVPRQDGLYKLYTEDAAYNNFTGLGFTVTGGGSNLTRRGYSYSFEEMIGATRGRHSVKFGGIFVHTRAGRIDVGVPTLTYANLNDFLSNTPSNVLVSLGLDDFQLRTSTTGFFVQDDFKVNRRLVLNLGIRWDYYTVPEERDDRIYNRSQPFGTGAFLPPDEIWKADWNNFSPRIGFAYSLGDGLDTVLQGGAGIFHNPQTLYGGPIDMVRNANGQPMSVRASRQDVLATGNLFRWPVDTARVAAVANTYGGGLDSGAAINNDFPYPMSYQWTLNLQKQFSRNLVLESGYVGTRGVNLMMVRSWNQPDRLTGIRPYAGLAQFRYRDPGEHSHYHAWQNALKKRFTKGFSFNVYYTYAYSYSYTSDSDLLLPNSVQDIYNIRTDKGPPSADLRHRFVSDFIYELPLAGLKSGKAGKNLLGGWQAAGIFNARTGSPLNLTQSSSLDSSRPDYVQGVPILADYRDTLQYLSRSAFARVPLSPVSGLPIRPGGVGRNSLRGPGFWNLDLCLAKSFYLTETVAVQFGTDMLNAFNHTNLTGLSTNIVNADFGRVNGTAGARQIQLKLRLTF